MADAFPIYLPPDARRLFSSEATLLRIARTAHWGPGPRLLELAASPAAGLLFTSLRANVTAVDSDPKALESVKERLKAAGLADKVALKQISWTGMPFAENEFDGILSLGRLIAPLETAAAGLRRYLAPKGRLALTWPVKVGRNPVQAALDFWQARLGQPLLLPREALMSVERHGYEPETIETVGETELDEYYAELETVLDRQPPESAAQAKSMREEIAMHKTIGGRTGVTIALVVARRKEPGERPPASRDGG
jgi:SAM-dependent methyltransferase